MAQTIPRDEELDLDLDEPTPPTTARGWLRLIAAMPDHLILAYLLCLGIIGGTGIILGMVAR